MKSPVRPAVLLPLAALVAAAVLVPQVAQAAVPATDPATSTWTVPAAPTVPLCAATGADHLVPGQSLTAGQAITSSGGTFGLQLGTDGDLTLRNLTTGHRVWAQHGGAGARLDLGLDGNLVLTGSDGTVRWQDAVHAPCGVVAVQDAGNVVEIQGGAAVWSAPRSATPPAVTVEVQSVDSLQRTTPKPAPEVTIPPVEHPSATRRVERTVPTPTVHAPAQVPARDVTEHPFASTSPWNTAIGSGVRFEPATGTMTRTFQTGHSAVNVTRWSYAVYHATNADPIATVTDPQHHKTYQIRVPRNAQPTAGTDRPVGIIEPDGHTAYEFYKMNNVGPDQWTSTRVVQTDLRGDGMADGSRASGISFFIGLIRTQELKDLAIEHTLAIGISDAQLKAGQVWPARTQDANAKTAYTGTIPMGTMFAIPGTVDVTSLGLTPEGVALAHALQNYGGHILLRASTNAIFCEQTCDTAQAKNLSQDWHRLMPLLRAVTNNTPSTVAGGGTPRVPALAPVS